MTIDPTLDDPITDDGLDGLDVPITDEELAALAMAADPDVPFDPDATPFDPGAAGGALLPSWYMPMPHRSRRSRRTTVGVALVVLAILVVNAVGLCVTYGHLQIPL